jgi:hypothetical protein
MWEWSQRRLATTRRFPRKSQPPRTRRGASLALTIAIVATLPGLNRSWLVKSWAISFVILIVLPITAPFQTITLSELLAANPPENSAVDSTIPFLSCSIDSAFSVVPPVDGTEGRLKLESRSAASLLNDPDLQQAVFSPLSAPNAIRSERPPVSVLRL